MASNEAVYESIGRTYSTTRREDPRVAEVIHQALGDARSVLNVGAGTGNYEPTDRPVVAIEPSATMLAQRDDRSSSSVVRGVGEALPFRTGSFDAAMAILTIHHWTDLPRGLAELLRVARRQVVLFFEPLSTHDFWALEYFPAALSLATEQHAPGEAELREHLEVRSVEPVLVPRDCLDGFGAAFWCRPEAYVDPAVQAGMSWLAQLPAAELAEGSARLRADLDSGEWARRNGHLLDLDEYDGGYRIAVAGD